MLSSTPQPLGGHFVATQCLVSFSLPSFSVGSAVPPAFSAGGRQVALFSCSTVSACEGHCEGHRLHCVPGFVFFLHLPPPQKPFRFWDQDPLGLSTQSSKFCPFSVTLHLPQLYAERGVYIFYFCLSVQIKSKVVVFLVNLLPNYYLPLYLPQVACDVAC